MMVPFFHDFELLVPTSNLLAGLLPQSHKIIIMKDDRWEREDRLFHLASGRLSKIPPDCPGIARTTSLFTFDGGHIGLMPPRKKISACPRLMAALLTSIPHTDFTSFPRFVAPMPSLDRT